MKLDIEKAVFQRGNKRTFMPLVDTRSLIQYKTNIITYGKKHDSILAYADAPLMIKAFQKFYIQF